jgi:hypothetical protein
MGYDDETSTPHRQAGEGEEWARRKTIHAPQHCSTCHR